MQLERRALYNLMRLNWLHNPSMPVEPWQVDDYRAMSLEAIFGRLRFHDLDLQRTLFVELANDYDSPDDFTEALLADTECDAVTQDQVYLLVFELWRRLLPEKPSLSVFCDELDYQIHSYDVDPTKHAEAIQDAIANLQIVLDENTDQGADSLEVFESISSGCANDVENFLYDYIFDQIEGDNLSYASDLLDGFIDYVRDIKWFDYLRALSVVQRDKNAVHEFIPLLLQDAIESPDLEFNLELLTFFVKSGTKPIFQGLARKTVPMLKTEEDFQDLLSICIDFFHRLDSEKEEKALQLLLRKRSHLHLDGIVDDNDQHLKELLAIIQ